MPDRMRLAISPDPDGGRSQPSAAACIQPSASNRQWAICDLRPAICGLLPDPHRTPLKKDRMHLPFCGTCIRSFHILLYLPFAFLTQGRGQQPSAAICVQLSASSRQWAICDPRPAICVQLSASSRQQPVEPYPLSRTVFKVIAPVFRQIDNSRTIIMDSLSCHP